MITGMPRLFSVAGAAWTLAALAVLAGAVAPAPVDRAAARILMDDGNFKDAFEPLKALALAPGHDGETAADFQRAVQCLQNLNRTTEVDALREAVAAAHPQDWIVLSEIAQNFLDLDHQGVMIAGQFERGGHRGGGKAAHALQRDRVRALQLFRQALDVVEAKAGEPKRGEELVMRDRFTAALQSLGGNRQAWRLQTLTDLTKLPDYEDGWWYGNGNVQGAPVNEQDNPILYAEPASWRAAKNDGERWRWALAAKSQRFPEHADRELLARAEFLNDQFGVQTMAEYSWWFARSADGDQGDSAKSQLQIESLGVDETIAKLASGIKRFKLPDEQNPIRLYQRIVEHAPHDSDPYRSALVLLAQVFENRRQYPRAA